MDEPRYSMSRSRAQFMGAIANVNPRCIEDLHASCLPLLNKLFEIVDFTLPNVRGRTRGYIGIAGDRVGIPKIDGIIPVKWASLSTSEDPGLLPLISALNLWSQRYRIEVEWVKAIAVQTLELWFRTQSAVEPKTFFCPITIMTAENSPESLGIKADFSLHVDECWDFESEDRFRARLKNKITVQVEEYIRRMRDYYADIKFDPDTRSTDGDRLQWLAAYQTIPLSLGSLKKKYNPQIDQSALQKSLQRTAAAIDLPLRGSLNKRTT